MQTPVRHTDVGLRATTAAVVLFGLIAGLIAWDIASDYGAGTETGHVMAEGLVMVLALAGAAGLWRQLRAARREAESLSMDLAAARLEAERFRDEAQDALRGLGEAIDAQFGRWGLTPAEREVGLLMLKGLSHRQIADARSTTETTIRQQALSIYRKSGLRNRSELSAFFLEDLLLPVAER
jgi:DNA-binding NarL/FixJ family response regulator